MEKNNHYTENQFKNQSSLLRGGVKAASSVGKKAVKSKAGKKVVAHGSKAIAAIIKFVIAHISIAFFGIFFIVLIVILLMSAVLLGGLEGDLGYGNIQDAIERSCVKRKNLITETIENSYYDKVFTIDETVPSYVQSNYGENIKNGNLNVLNGKDAKNGWDFNGFNEDHRIRVELSSSLDESAETISAYLEAIYTVNKNLNSVAETTEYDFDDLFQDYRGFNDNNTVFDINDYLDDIEKYKNNFFYINEDGNDWTDDLHQDKWTVLVETTGSCTISINQEGQFDTLCPEGSGKDVVPVYDTVSNTITYTWTDYVEVEKEGLVGTIRVPIHFDSVAMGAEEREEAVQNTIESCKNNVDKNYDYTTAYQDYYYLVNTTLQTTASICGGRLNFDLFGSVDLSGIGNLGYIGETTAPPRYEKFRYDASKGYRDNSQLFNKDAINEIWGYAFNLQTQGLIGGQYHGTQCTTFVHAMFYDVYGYDCGLGDGWKMADNTVALYPDKFVISSTPAPNSVMSTLSYNHVAFVNAVYDDNGDNVWDRIVVSDGNVNGGGLRILAEYDRDSFRSVFGMAQKFAIPVR